jgi:hypothetical protein
MRRRILRSNVALRIAALCTIAAATIISGAAFVRAQEPAVDHRHDFDFEFGSWKTTLRMQPRPLTTSTGWVTYVGTSVVHKLLNGQANIGELEVSSGTSRIDALSLRMYDARSRRWNIYFANAVSGLSAVPTVGRFSYGRGEFYDSEQLNGKPIKVRFVFDKITATSFEFVQSFSSDEGKMWVPNWIATFTR